MYIYVHIYVHTYTHLDVYIYVYVTCAIFWLETAGSIKHMIGSGHQPRPYSYMTYGWVRPSAQTITYDRIIWLGQGISPKCNFVRDICVLYKNIQVWITTSLKTSYQGGFQSREAVCFWGGSISLSEPHAHCCTASLMKKTYIYIYV